MDNVGNIVHFYYINFRAFLSVFSSTQRLNNAIIYLKISYYTRTKKSNISCLATPAKASGAGTMVLTILLLMAGEEYGVALLATGDEALVAFLLGEGG